MRILILVFATAVLGLGGWIASVDTLAAFASATPVEWAARIGVLRGDLWAKAAWLAAGLEASGDGPKAASLASSRLDLARPQLFQALQLTPLRSNLWLMLSLASAPQSDSASSTLDMAYQTGGGIDSERPIRLLAATRIGVPDIDLANLIRLDVERIVLADPTQLPALRRTYDLAAPELREVFTEAAQTVDPAFRFSIDPAFRFKPSTSD